MEAKKLKKKQKRNLMESDVVQPIEKYLHTDCSDNEMHHDCDSDFIYKEKMQSSRVILNVGGAIFETSIFTLTHYPESLLAKLFTQRGPMIPQGNSRDASHF